MTGFQIGGVKIENRLALGPMAGVTDLPFRLLCKEQGCGLLYTEIGQRQGPFSTTTKTPRTCSRFSRRSGPSRCSSSAPTRRS